MWNSKKLAQLIRAEVIENTLAGLDKDGKPFKEYSTNPFTMPYQAIARKEKADPYLIWLSEHNKNSSNSARGIKYLSKTQTGKKYIKVLWWGGHKEYKKTMYGTDTVNLSATGGMLKSFGVLSVREKWLQESIFDKQKFTLPVPEIWITLGWKDAIQAQKAYWNINRDRNMLGLPEKKLNSLVVGFAKAYIAGI